MQSKAKTVSQYLNSLPVDRKKAVQSVRKVILKNLPKGFEERFTWGMICYQVPLSRFADTYNGQPLMLAALASQKNHMSVYLMNMYADKKTEKWFRDEYKKRGLKLDMGKSCVRFKKLDDLPLDLVGQVVKLVTVDKYIERYKRTKR